MPCLAATHSPLEGEINQPCDAQAYEGSAIYAFSQHHFALIAVMLSLHDSFTNELQVSRNATDSEALPSAQLAAEISAPYSL